MGKNSDILSNNITKIIKNDEKINILNQIYCEEKYIISKASDFEWFDLWECASILCAGHKELDLYCSELRERGLKPPAYSEICREYSVIRWRSANGIDLPARKSVADAAEKRAGEYVKSTLRIDKRDEDIAVVHLKDYVSDFTNKYQGLSQLSERIWADIKMLENACVILSADLYSEKYERPDPYGASQLFLRKTSGEKLNNKEENIILSQLLIEIIIRSKKEKIIRLLINEDGGFRWSSSLIEYLERRRLFTGDIWVKAEPNDIPILLYNQYTGIKAAPFIDFDDAAFTKEQLVAAFREYPVGGFIFKSGRQSRELLCAIESVAQSREHARLLLALTCI